jgi:hypothetical protein
VQTDNFLIRPTEMRLAIVQACIRGAQGMSDEVENEDIMNKILIIALTCAATITGVASTAEARQGCGVGFHRGPYGACRPNVGRGPVVVVPGGPRVGVFYGGRGYWDGHRYWMHRHAWHRGWRYY